MSENVEKLYKDLFDDYCMEYQQEADTTLDMFTSSISDRDLNDVLEITDYVNYLTGSLEDLEGYNPPTFVFDATSKINSAFSKEISKYESDRKELINKYSRLKVDLEQDKKSKIDKAEASLNEFVSDREKELEKLKSRHNFIKSKKSELEKIFRLYNLNAIENSIDIDKLTTDELEDLFTIGEFTIKQILGTPKIFGKVMKWLYYPVEVEEKYREEALTGYGLCIICFCYLFGPYVLALIGLLSMIKVASEIFDVKQKKALLQATYNLTKDIDYEKFIRQSEGYDDIVQDVELSKEIDIKYDIEELDMELQEKLNDLDKNNPSKEVDKCMLEYSKFLTSDDYVDRVDVLKMKVVSKKTQAIKTLKAEIDKYKKALANLKDNATFLGDRISNSTVMDYSIYNSVLYNGSEKVIEGKFELPKSSVAFLYDDEFMQRDLIDYMKLLLCNMLLNVRQKKLIVKIFDEVNMGRDFPEFNNIKLSGLVSIIDKDLNKELDEYANIIRTNNDKKKEKTIEDYNEECMKTGIMPLTYNLLIVVSTSNNLIETKEFQRLLGHEDAGMLVWYMTLNPDKLENKEKDKVQSLLSNSVLAYGPGKIFANGVQIDMIDDRMTRYDYDISLGYKVVNTYIYALEHEEPDILTFTDYANRVVPKDKIWTYDTLDGIELQYGFEDGDPFKKSTCRLDDDTPHCLMAGDTGSGKSVCINETLAIILKKYSPKWLQVVMIDFKRVEFANYKGAREIPHARIIAGTEDGGYAESIFRYLIAEMKSRFAMFEKNGVRNIRDYNKLMLRLGKEDAIVPRILFLVDEFRQMFIGLEQSVVDVIKGLIEELANLARACGCHMLFCSQDMAKTLPQNVMNQFALRACLSCGVETSKFVLGNDKSAYLPKKGWIITNPTKGVDEKANQLWRVPYITDEELDSYLIELNQKCKDEGYIHNHAKFFDEKELFPEENLLKWLEHPVIKANRGMILLGERVSFAFGKDKKTGSYIENKLPEFMRFKNEDKENVMFVAYAMKSVLDMTTTFIYNLRTNETIDVLIHCADKRVCNLLDLENKVSGSIKGVLDYDTPVGDLLEILESKISKRKANPDKEYRDTYILAIYWDKYTGIGDDQNYGYFTRLQELFRIGPRYGIHFITLISDTKALKKLADVSKHKLGSYAESKDSFNLLETELLTKKLKDNTTRGYYNYAGKECYFKLYDCKVNGVIEEEELLVTARDENLVM